MKEGYIIRNQTLPHFITATVVDWVDVFSRKNYREYVIDCLDYCIKNKGMILYSYVIMSNHIHMFVQSNEGKLSDLLRDFKKFTSKTILDKIQTEPEIRREWMLERFQLATEKFMWSKIDYIHFNPVRAGIVSRPQDYIYSSASNYVDGKGIINIELVEIPIVNVLYSNSFIKYNSYE